MAVMLIGAPTDINELRSSLPKSNSDRLSKLENDCLRQARLISGSVQRVGKLESELGEAICAIQHSETRLVAPNEAALVVGAGDHVECGS